MTQRKYYLYLNLLEGKGRERGQESGHRVIVSSGEVKMSLP